MVDSKEYFSARAKTALNLAEIETKYLQHPAIETPHVLLGLFDEKDGIGGLILRQIGLSREYLVELIKSKQTSQPEAVESSELLAPTTKKLLELSVDEARRFRHLQIGTGHLLIAVIRQHNPITQNVLNHLHIQSQDFVNQIRHALVESVDPLDRPILQQERSAKRVNNSGWWYRLTSGLLALIGVKEVPPARTDLPQKNPDEFTTDARRIENVTEVLRLEPDNVDLRAYRGALYMHQKDYDAAIADFTEVIRLKPDASDYCNRGAARHNKKDYDGAIADFAEMIRISPEDSSGYLRRADSLLAKGEYDRAIADFTEAIRLNPNDSTMYSFRAWAYLSNNEQDEAIVDCNEALRLNPDDSRAYHYRGAAYADQKDYEAAEADFQAMYRLCPKYSWSYSNLGWLHLLKEDYDLAITDCTEAIRIVAENGAAYYVRGTALAAKGDHQGAVTDYRMALEHWEYIHSKRSEHYVQIMKSYVEQWDKPITGPGDEFSR